MALTMHSARIMGPVPYTGRNGRQVNIPLGPCLVEQLDGCLVDIIWGASGQRSAELPLKDMATATERGHLVLLD
jgi:hypothetical protein